MKGGKAMGISGIDGHLIEAEVKDERLGYVGRITKVNIEPITDLLEKGYIPVVSTVGCDMEGNVYNVNADTAAARIAGVLGAECLLSMTDISGIMRDCNDPTSLIPLIDIADAHKLMGEGVISGGMIPKVLCCIDAIEQGVKKVTIMDGRIPHAILLETLTDEGAGTMVVAKKKKSRREFL
jgi:acetylglutamate kinase